MWYPYNLAGFIVCCLVTVYVLLGLILLYFKFYTLYDKFYPPLNDEFFGTLYVCITFSCVCVTIYDGCFGMLSDTPMLSLILSSCILGTVALYGGCYLLVRIFTFFFDLRKNMPER